MVAFQSRSVGSSLRAPWSKITFHFIAPVFPGKPGMFLISPLIGPQQLLFLFPANEKRALIFLRPREAS